MRAYTHVCMYVCSHTHTHTHTGDAVPPPAQKDSAVCLPVSAAAALVFSAVLSSSNVVGALSTITVSLQANVDLEPNVLVTVAGLHGTQVLLSLCSCSSPDLFNRDTCVAHATAVGVGGAPTLDDAAMPIRVMSWHMCCTCVLRSATDVANVVRRADAGRRSAADPRDVAADGHGRRAPIVCRCGRRVERWGVEQEAGPPRTPGGSYV